MDFRVDKLTAQNYKLKNYKEKYLNLFKIMNNRPDFRTEQKRVNNLHLLE